jgi:hypothetical protein
VCGTIAGSILVTALFHAPPAAAQRAPTAPSGDVFSSSGNCQVAHQRAAEQANAQHSRDWPACGGDSACIRAANAKKAEALRAAGQQLRLCQASGGTTSPPTASNPPMGRPQPIENIQVAPPPRNREPVPYNPPPSVEQGPSPGPSRRPRPPYVDVTPSVTRPPQLPGQQPPGQQPPGQQPPGQQPPGTGQQTATRPQPPGKWTDSYGDTYELRNRYVSTSPEGKKFAFPLTIEVVNQPYVLDKSTIKFKGSRGGLWNSVAKYRNPSNANDNVHERHGTLVQD